MELRSVTPTSIWRLYNSSAAASIDYTRYPGVIDTVGSELALSFEKPNEVYYNPATFTFPTANLYSFAWDKYIREITSPDNKIMRCYIKLTDLDVANIDFKKLVKINGVLWKLNEVVEYRLGTQTSTMCEFQKYINIDFISPDEGTPA